MSYNEAKRLADFAYNKASRDHENQNNEKFNAMTRRFFSSAYNPVTFFLIALIVILSYVLYKENAKMK